MMATMHLEPVSPKLMLASHGLCPYVQRVAIVLAEKRVPFERREVDLSDKPAWFRRISPLGKTPVLVVDDDAAIFESAVISEYVEEVFAPALHPSTALQRARHRAWIEFASALLASITAFYNAADDAALESKARELRTRFEALEQALSDGPYFDGASFAIVDAAFAPVFRYFDLFDRIADFGFDAGLTKLRAWRSALAARPSVQAAVRPDYPQRLEAFVARRGSALSRRMLSSDRHRTAVA